jgi:hypothetical protein
MVMPNLFQGRIMSMNTWNEQAKALAQPLESLLVSRYPVTLPSEYRYAHLSLALIDAVFSLGARYESTRATVLRFAKVEPLRPFRESLDVWPSLDAQQPLADLLTRYRQRGMDSMLSEVYQNRQRTSSHESAITKAEAVLRAATLLVSYHVNYFQDIPKVMANRSFADDFRAIPGQTSGTGLAYLWMLTGSDMHIKPDRMVIRFIEQATSLRGLSPQQTQRLVEAALELLRPQFPGLTVRQIDYVIWSYERFRTRHA